MNALDVVVVLWNSGILSAVAWFVIKLVTAHTKNKNILMFNEWAKQAVAYAEANFDGGNIKKLEAYEFIVGRLKANNLFDRFSEDQIEAIIEWAVNELHAKGA